MSRESAELSVKNDANADELRIKLPTFVSDL
jgi:hypothetical protein